MKNLKQGGIINKTPIALVVDTDEKVITDVMMKKYGISPIIRHLDKPYFEKLSKNLERFQSMMIQNSRK